jgi:hypothetical protein
MFLQFVQQPAPRLELERLLAQAARFFSAELEVLAEDTAARRATLRWKTKPDPETSFELHARLTDAADRVRLAPAELANQSYGMAGLGERCPCVWEVLPAPDAAPAACFQFGALLASVALGPWLPPDDSGLFGVRSARLIAERLRTS